MTPDEHLLNPTIFIGSFEFREPVTTLTDVTVSLICGAIVWYFVKHKHRAQPTLKLYILYFAFFGIGLFLAAWLGHGLQAYMGPRYKIPGWIGTVTAQAFLAMASLRQIKNYLQPRQSKIISTTIFSILVVVVILILTPSTSSFKLPQVGNALLLLGGVLPMQWVYFSKTKNSGSLYVFYASSFGVVLAAVYHTRFSFSPWFNFHDIGHVLMAMTMVGMFFAVKKLALKAE